MLNVITPDNFILEAHMIILTINARRGEAGDMAACIDAKFIASLSIRIGRMSFSGRRESVNGSALPK